MATLLNAKGEAPPDLRQEGRLLLVLSEIWKRKLDHINLLPPGMRGVFRQLLEKQPLIRPERPQRELRNLA